MFIFESTGKTKSTGTPYIYGTKTTIKKHAELGTDVTMIKRGMIRFTDEESRDTAFKVGEIKDDSCVSYFD